MKHFTYKITFPGMPWYYYGVHMDNGKPYFGSPKTHKWRWDFYEYEVQILEWFETREEADSVEKRIIDHFLNDLNCLNECAGGKFSLESLRRGALTKNQLPVRPDTKEKIGKATKERWGNFSPEERSILTRQQGLWSGTPEHLRKEVGLKIQKAKGTPVTLLDTKSGEVKDFLSLRSARAHYHIGMSTILKLYSGEIPEFKGLQVIRAGLV